MGLSTYLKNKIKRPPDFIVGEDENPYLLRWWIVKSRFGYIYLHKFLRSDDDRALHDHPYHNCSIVLRSGYQEHLPGRIIKTRRPGNIVFRKATQAHRIQLDTNFFGQEEPAWTLFIAGPKIREWGFLCPKGWVHNNDFTDPTDPGKVGKGCNQ